MEIILYIIVALLLVVIGGVYYFISLQKKSEKPAEDSQSMLLMQGQIENLSKVLDSKLESFNKQLFDSNKDMRSATHAQFSESQKLMSDINKQMSAQMQDVTKQVTEAKETSKQVLTITDQLRNLEKYGVVKRKVYPEYMMMRKIRLMNSAPRHLKPSMFIPILFIKIP